MYDLVKLLDHLYNFFFFLIIYYQLMFKEGKAFSVKFGFQLGGPLKNSLSFPLLMQYQLMLERNPDKVLKPG